MQIECIKENLKNELNKINFSIKGKSPNCYIYDYKNQRTKWRVWNDKITCDHADDNVSIDFYFKDCFIELLDDNCVSLFGKDNQSIFILFSNYEIKEKELV